MRTFFTVIMEVYISHGQMEHFALMPSGFVSTRDFHPRWKLSKKRAIEQARKYKEEVMPLTPLWRIKNEWFPQRPIRGIRIAAERNYMHKSGVLTQETVKEFFGINDLTIF